MKIQTIVVGDLGVNCYILTDGNEAIVIDPGSDCEKILSVIEKEGASLSKILLTHGHFDHIGAVCDLQEKTDATVWVHKDDEEMLSDDDKNLANTLYGRVKHCKADKNFADGDVIPFGENEIKVYHTPGHSNGGVCLEIGKNLFSGDLLFQGSIGRFDYGDLHTELKSLKFLMDNFSDETVVYPGHGSSTTIGEEKVYNPYIVNHVMR